MTDTSLTAAAAASPLAKILTAAGQVGYHWDLRADHLIWFGEWQKLFGYDKPHPPFNSATFASYVHPDDRALVLSPAGAEINRTYRLVLESGRTLVVHEQGTVESDSAGPLRQCGMIEPQAAAAPEPRDIAGERLDPLTRSLTREAMALRMSAILTGPRPSRDKGAYLVIGIDRMAFVNEAIGTKAADALLCNVAQRLAEIVPSEATLARVSGDMFGVLLPDDAGLDYNKVANKVLEAFRNQAVPALAAPVFITTSIGAICFADQGSSATEVMIRAEQALNEARLRGRNVMVPYQVSGPRVESRRTAMEMGERFKYALLNNKLRLAYQPVIDSQTGQVVFYEALIRMFKDNGELIPAADFVPAVEVMGMAQDLDYHVLDLTLAELKTYPNLRLAMNISGLTASRQDWPDYLAEKLSAIPNVAKRLIIEITETVAISDLSETQRFAETLNKLGGSVAIDDFGAGFTSIRHLSTLSLSIMKVDKDMLKNVPGNPEQEHLIRMMLAIARGLGLKTVVEGIETEEVARWLQKEKADMMQGYYFGRPSIDRPWLALAGADMTDEKVSALFSGNLFSETGTVQVRVGSLSAT